jgi:hypothetical protein
VRLPTQYCLTASTSLARTPSPGPEGPSSPFEGEGLRKARHRRQRRSKYSVPGSAVSSPQDPAGGLFSNAVPPALRKHVFIWSAVASPSPAGAGGATTPLWIEHPRAPAIESGPGAPGPHSIWARRFFARVPSSRFPVPPFPPPPPAPGSAVSSLRFCGNPFPTPGYPPSPRLRRAGRLPATGYHKMRKASGT